MIGLERNEAWGGLKKLTFNYLHYQQRSCHINVAVKYPIESLHATNILVNT